MAVHMDLIEMIRNLIICVVSKVMMSGPLPRHVGLILDGNRRYSKKARMTNYNALQQTWHNVEKLWKIWRSLGIREVSCYVLSTENFGRSKQDIDDVLNALEYIIDDYHSNKSSHIVNKYQIRVVLSGDITFRKFPLKIQQKLAKLASDTQHFKNDIDEKLVEDCLYSSGMSPVDLLIRTSGEVRLSDYLLWQTSFGILHFPTLFFPEFGTWNMLKSLFFYQRQVREMQKLGCRLPESQTSYNIEGNKNETASMLNAGTDSIVSKGCTKRKDKFVQHTLNNRLEFFIQMAQDMDNYNAQ